MGNVIATDPKDAYLSRVAAIDAGLPIETPAFNVNRLCGSGLQAIVSAAQAIALGDCDLAIGGGSELGVTAENVAARYKSELAGDRGQPPWRQRHSCGGT
jgi:acetyl-CoA acetyltransferase